MLAAKIPDSEIDVGQVYEGDILAYCGHCLQVRMEIRAVEALDLFQQGSLARVVEA